MMAMRREPCTRGNLCLERIRSGLKVDGKKHWIWTFTTRSKILIAISKSREKKVLKEVQRRHRLRLMEVLLELHKPDPKALGSPPQEAENTSPRGLKKAKPLS